jgi:hypothetical protein
MSAHTDRLAFVVDYLSRTLTRHGIWHTLAFGTLLGAVRDGDIIPWDSDVDFFIRPADIPRLLALNPDMAADGVSLVEVNMSASVIAVNPGAVTNATGARLVIDVGGARAGDLYALSLFSDGVLRWYDFDHETYWCPESSFPHYFVETLETVMLRGKSYPAPRDAEKWCEATYGPGWRTPFKAGSPRTADVNVWGYTFEPPLASLITWCEARGWSREAYAGEPHWPRKVVAVGPEGWAPRGEDPEAIRWWKHLDQIVRWY